MRAPSTSTTRAPTLRVRDEPSSGAAGQRSRARGCSPPDDTGVLYEAICRMLVEQGCRCAECGHIGCCDSSPGQHASKHAAATGHPIICSFEPDEDWFYDYEKQEMINGVQMLPPHAHSKSQPTPGPAGRVPSDWESLVT